MKDQPVLEYSPAIQDYLRAIYQLTAGSDSEERATTSKLAERLSVRPASITAMLQKMATTTPALVDYYKSYGVRLSPDGERAALRVVRFHRLLELFLHEKLAYGWDEVHEEADRLEHVISAEMAERISETLGNPTHDPHGHIIPAADLTIHRPETKPLHEMEPQETAVVQSVSDDDADLLRFLGEIGLRPGVRVTTMCESPDGVFRLRIDGDDPIPLEPGVAQHVFVGRYKSNT